MRNKSNNFSRTKAVVFHIDVNSAYLAWESLERIKAGEIVTVVINGRECQISDLRAIPSIVGGDPETRRGIVLSKSLPCKPYKIQTGESLMSAVKKCPGLYVAPARFGIYERYSDDLITYLHNFSDRVQQYSIDEAFVDYTHMERHFGSPLEAADKIRNGIREAFGFTVSIGVGPNKLLAKMATGLRKPDFTNTLLEGEIGKMWALPIEELFMAGRATAPKLRKLGIQTIGDLARFDVRYLVPTFKSFSHVLWNYANGIDDSAVEPHHSAAKSVGNSTTIPFDVTRYDDANRVLLNLCESVGKRLRLTHTAASSISIGIRNSDFIHYSHQRRCSPTDNTTTLYNHAAQLFKEAWKRDPVRQLGVRADKLSDSRMGQLNLFGQEETDRQMRLDASIDSIRRRFGDEAVMRASFLCKDEKRDHTLDRFSPFRSTGGL
ncbi:MAG: DNA polymerase IV [Defluviitaleaceae bacterium]|nr:DNA polymerase IV [Defluviitaleaceae bacterium]